MIEFSPDAAAVIRERANRLVPGDLVILVQSSSFRLNDFRFRLELFNRNLAVMEHPHLGRMPESEYQTYIDSLAYDPAYYRTLGLKLKQRIDVAQKIVVSSPGARLEYHTTFETAKLNIGDYTGMKNIGGQFPIGEVFTEPVDLSGVNGTVKLFAYGGMGFKLAVPEESVLVVIEKGLIVDAPNAPKSFQEVLDQIRQDEPLWVRELGFGMNPALTRNRLLTDIGSYERMCGIHLSLGQKHTVYAKPGFSKRKSKYHVDVFVDVTTVEIEGEVVYRDGAYCL
jgi:leucyl aminopeptidase (aminopeptidase T)